MDGRLSVGGADLVVTAHLSTDDKWSPLHDDQHPGEATTRQAQEHRPGQCDGSGEFSSDEKSPGGVQGPGWGEATEGDAGRATQDGEVIGAGVVRWRGGGQDVVNRRAGRNVDEIRECRNVHAIAISQSAIRP
jgi:hypothetical protein